MNNHKLKKIIFVLAMCVFVLFSFILFTEVENVMAQETVTSQDDLDYEPLVGLPGVKTDGELSLAGYLNAMFRLFLGLATVLAVLMIVVGGFLYMTSTSEPGTKAAKERISNAIIGLLIALAAWLILYEVNPDLLNFDLKLQPAEEIELEDSEDGGEAWGDDSGVRSQLTSGNSKISINKANCKQVGDTNCTSLYQLPISAINGLKKLANDCNCAIRITGGTEYWLHKTHGPGKAVVDTSPISALNEYITGSSGTPALGCFEKVSKNGVVFQWEPRGCGGSTGNHWHIIF